MRKLYNTHLQISSDLSKFFKFAYPAISKPHLKNSTDVVLGMVKSESAVTTDIVKNLNCRLIFLADQWFNLREIMHHIDSLGDIYCIRTKSNVYIEIGNYENASMISYISDIEPFFQNLFILIAFVSLALNFPLNLLLARPILIKNLSLY